MVYNKEILISYSSRDDEPLEAEGRGWVTSFCKFLTTFLSQIMKEQPRVRMINELALHPQEIEEATVFVAIVSKNFISTPGLINGMMHFGQRAKNANSLHVEGKSRMLKVIKHPADIDTILPEFEDILGYDLFMVDPKSGHAQEYTRFFGTEAEKSYWLKLVDLTYDICEILVKPAMVREVQGNELPRQRTIYLSGTGIDILTHRDFIKRELLRHGYRVLPEQALPKDAKLLEEMVLADLEKCQLSIHMVGEHYGDKPSGSDYSVAEIQGRIAAEYAAQVAEYNSEAIEKKLFNRIIWISPHMANISERQKLFIENLTSEVAEADDAELVRVTLQELKSIIMEELNTGGRHKIGHQFIKETEDNNKEKRIIYLIHDRQDEEDVEPLVRELKKKGCEVITPRFEGDLIDLRYLHQESLCRCDASIIYLGKSHPQWIRTKLQDLLKAPGFGRVKPIMAKAIYMAPEAASRAGEFLGEDNTLVIAGSHKPAPGMLEPFFERLEK